MKRFIIEREIAGASELSADQLADIARTSTPRPSRWASPTPG